jgi:hypothetical protein
MNQLSRRAFFKRSGTATLAAALGGNLIPSFSSKLKALDTSGGIQGVKASLSSATASVTSAGHAYAGGIIKTGVAMTTALSKNTCHGELTLSWRRWITFEINGTVTAQTEQVWSDRWWCDNGTPNVERTFVTGKSYLQQKAVIDANGNHQGILEPLACNTSDTHSETGVVVGDGLGTEHTPRIYSGRVSVSVICCQL